MNKKPKKIPVGDLPSFDMAEELKSDEDIALYLSLALEEDDPEELKRALSTVARARGMTEVAKASNVTREALYKALRPNSKPQFNTVRSVFDALGVKLVAVPKGGKSLLAQ